MQRHPVSPALLVVCALVGAGVVGSVAGCPNEVATPGCGPGGCKPPEPEEPPRLFIDPPFGLGYDCVTIGCGDERTLTVENRGGGKVRLSLVRLSVDTSSDFSLRRADDGALPFDETTTVDVTPDTPLTLTVRYTPSDGNSDAGKVLVDWYDGALEFADAVVTHVELPLSTRELGGVAATLVEPRLNFGFVDVGDEGRRDIVVRNSGDGGVLSVGPVSLEDGTAAVFVEPAPGDWGEHFVNPGDELRIPVAFRPDATAAFLGALQVRTSDGATPSLRVEVAGTAVAEPRVLASTSAIAFGDIRVGVTRTETVTVTNIGGAPLTFVSSVASGAGVQLSSTAPVTVAPLESASFDVAWTPVVGGPFSGAVQLVTDDPTQPQVTVTLDGFADAPLLSAAPASVDFGGVVQGWTTGAQTFLLSNTGFGELTVNSISFEVGASSQIVLTDVPALPIKLSPGEEPIALSVFMSASTLGTQQAVILVGSDSVDGPLGTGGVGRLNVSGRVITCEEGCPVANGQPSCGTGSCAIATCNDRFHDANTSLTDGCECHEDPVTGAANVFRDVSGQCGDTGVDLGTVSDSGSELIVTGTLHSLADTDLYFVRFNDGSGNDYGARARFVSGPSGMRLVPRFTDDGEPCGQPSGGALSPGQTREGGGCSSFLCAGNDSENGSFRVEWAPGIAPQCGTYTLSFDANASY